MQSKNHRQYVVAPAGHGKTEAISKIVSEYVGDKKILILTHTNAGVLSLRKRINKKTKNKCYEIYTIDSFSIKYAMRFPSFSCVINAPRKDAEYKKCREGVVKIVKTKYFQNVLKQNYEQIIVDEYQDCNLEQHTLITYLSESVPCLIFGDPMQGIFSFGGNILVDWIKDIPPLFDAHAEIKLDIPHRWISHGVPALGKQIHDIRCLLEKDDRTLSSDGAINIIKTPNMVSELSTAVWNRVREKNSLLIILDDSSPTGTGKRFYARQFKGFVQIIDSIEFQPFFTFLDAIENSDGPDMCEAIKEFVRLCATNTDADFKSLCNIRNGATGTCTIKRKDKNEEHRLILLCRLIKKMIESKGKERVKVLLSFFDLIESYSNYSIIRKDIWRSARQASNHYIEQHSNISLEEAGRSVRRNLSFVGRNFKNIIATTLLTKGLEYDTVIIMDSDKLKNNKDLYVAMSRAKKELIIIKS